VFADPQFRAREAIVSVPDSELGAVRMQCVVPRYSATPCTVRSAGPALGQHNDEVYAALGVTREQVQALRAAGVV
jgi:crotonobetainyl-CoA:carnitine CoA-transferase CaiB-like acyl-CoA transferase